MQDGFGCGGGGEHTEQSMVLPVFLPLTSLCVFMHLLFACVCSVCHFSEHGFDKFSSFLEYAILNYVIPILS